MAHAFEFIILFKKNFFLFQIIFYSNFFFIQINFVSLGIKKKKKNSRWETEKNQKTFVVPLSGQTNRTCLKRNYLIQEILLNLLTKVKAKRNEMRRTNKNFNKNRMKTLLICNWLLLHFKDYFLYISFALLGMYSTFKHYPEYVMKSTSMIMMIVMVVVKNWNFAVLQEGEQFQKVTSIFNWGQD